MTNHYFFGGRLHSPKPPSPGARLDVLVLRPVTSAIRDGRSSGAKAPRGLWQNGRNHCASIKSELIIWFRNFSYLPMKSFSTNGLASQGADSHIASRVVTFYPYNLPLNFSLTNVKKFIGFVGTSRPVSVGAFAVAVNKVLSKYSNLDTVVVSGGEPKGVDTIAVNCARQAGFEVLEYTPAVKSWEGANGYKARNIQIANKCEFVYSFVNRSGNPSCYHCHASHHKSAGCYTARLCKGGHEVVLV